MLPAAWCRYFSNEEAFKFRYHGPIPCTPCHAKNGQIPGCSFILGVAKLVGKDNKARYILFLLFVSKLMPSTHEMAVGTESAHHG